MQEMIMKKIDVSKWKYFRISELFVTRKQGANLYVPTGAQISKKNLEAGNIPRITATNTNNGISGYYADFEDKNYRVYENFISVSFLGSAFYQSGKASLDMKVHCLKPLNYALNKYSAGFLATVLRKVIAFYEYDDQLSSKALAEMSIPLPTSSDGNPDWKYMEEYMRKIMKETSALIDNLKRVKSERDKIDTGEWKEFLLTDIGFSVIHGKRMKKTDRNTGNIPLLTAGKENQGVAAYIDNPLIVCKDAITVDMFGNTFFHKGAYAGDDNIYFFVNNSISDMAKLFLTTVIKMRNKGKYDYSDQFRQTQADSLSIRLPKTKEGEPDWDYMERYMCRIMESTKGRLDALRKASR